jgi:hypothetical protein
MDIAADVVFETNRRVLEMCSKHGCLDLALSVLKLALPTADGTPWLIRHRADMANLKSLFVTMSDTKIHERRKRAAAEAQMAQIGSAKRRCIDPTPLPMVKDAAAHINFVLESYEPEQRKLPIMTKCLNYAIEYGLKGSVTMPNDVPDKPDKPKPKEASEASDESKQSTRSTAPERPTITSITWHARDGYSKVLTHIEKLLRLDHADVRRVTHTKPTTKREKHSSCEAPTIVKESEVKCHEKLNKESVMVLLRYIRTQTQTMEPELKNDSKLHYVGPVLDQFLSAGLDETKAFDKVRRACRFVKDSTTKVSDYLSVEKGLKENVDGAWAKVAKHLVNYFADVVWDQSISALFQVAAFLLEACPPSMDNQDACSAVMQSHDLSASLAAYWPAYADVLSFGNIQTLCVAACLYEVAEVLADNDQVAAAVGESATSLVAQIKVVTGLLRQRDVFEKMVKIDRRLASKEAWAHGWGVFLAGAQEDAFASLLEKGTLHFAVSKQGTEGVDAVDAESKSKWQTAFDELVGKMLQDEVDEVIEKSNSLATSATSTDWKRSLSKVTKVGEWVQIPDACPVNVEIAIGLVVGIVQSTIASHVLADPDNFGTHGLLSKAKKSALAASCMAISSSPHSRTQLR